MLRSLPGRLRLDREAAAVLAFSVLNTVLGLAANRFLTEVVEPQALGEYYLLINLALWLVMPTASVYAYVWRHWPVAVRQGRGRWLARRMGLGLGGQAALAAAGSVVLAGLIGWPAVPWLALVCVGFAVSQAFDLIQTLERRRVIAGVLELIRTPLRQIVLALGSLLAVQSGVLLLRIHAVYGLLAAAFSVAMLLCVLRRERPAAAGDPPRDFSARFILGYSAPYFLTAAFTQLSTTAERWGLARLADTGQTALFVLALGLSTAAVTAVVTPGSLYYQAIISNRAAEGERPLAQALQPILRYALLTAVLLSGLVAGVTLLARPLTALAFGPAFAGIRTLLPWTILGAALFALGQCLVMIPMVRRDTIGPNVTLIASKAVYVGLLFSAGAEVGEAALVFARCYALSHVLYVVLMVLACAVQVRRARREERP